MSDLEIYSFNHYLFVSEAISANDSWNCLYSKPILIELKRKQPLCK